MRTYARAIPPELWRQALDKNPDPTRLVPIPARSFEDIKNRVEKQKKRVEVMNDFLKVSDDWMLLNLDSKTLIYLSISIQK